VELDGNEHIAGWLVPEHGPRERFEGLLEMVAAVERLRHKSEHPDAARDGLKDE
jgi:hypothetical protein